MSVSLMTLMTETAEPVVRKLHWSRCQTGRMKKGNKYRAGKKREQLAARLSRKIDGPEPEVKMDELSVTSVLDKYRL